MKTKYYSEILDKYFDTVKELEEAEKAEEEKKKLRAKEKEERQKEAADVQEAANNFLHLVAENKKIREQLNEKENSAYLDFKTKMDDFSKKHNGYHLSYTYDGKNAEFKVEEVRYVALRDFMEQRQSTIEKMMADIINF